MDKTYLTPEGFRRVKSELEHVKSVKIPYAANRVKGAKGYGDQELIQDALEEQKFYFDRVKVLERMLATAIPL